MPKYIRTKEGIYEVVNESETFYECMRNVFVSKDIFYHKDKVADTIEELIQDNDVLYIHDLYPDTVLVVEGNIKPFGYNEKIELKKWLKYKTKFDLYIRNSRGDYIRVAKMNEKGELELL